MIINQISDAFQNLPHEVWSEFAAEVMGLDSANLDPDCPFSVILSFLGDCSAENEIFCGKLDKIDSPWTEQQRWNFQLDKATALLRKPLWLLFPSNP